MPSRMQHMSSNPTTNSPSCFSRYPGTCCVDQVGVKAPGRPTILAYSAMSIFSTSGKPWKSSTEGSLSPAATLSAVAERAFDTEGAKAAALPARVAARRSFMAVIFGLLFNDFRRTSAQKSVGQRWWSSEQHQRRETRRQRRSDDGLTYLPQIYITPSISLGTFHQFSGPATGEEKTMAGRG